VEMFVVYVGIVTHFHDRWVPCHCGMAHPRFADGANGHRQPTGGGPPAWGRAWR
jgi:hypothetical protein